MIFPRCFGRCLLALLALGSAACNQPASPPPQGAKADAPAAALIARGRAVYNFRCYYCHGYSGDGKTLAATYLTSPPRNFQAADASSLPPEVILSAVRDGRPNSAMKSFAKVISAQDIEAVAAFVFDEFVVRKAPNTRYHTPENGWPDHERYRSAYPFALGEVALTVAADSLNPDLQRGRELYLNSCISCHDRGKPVADQVTWDSRALSFPRNNYDHKNPNVDASTSATPFRLHDVAPVLDQPSAAQKRGAKIFQENCAFCHAPDGTGKNWIGAFLEPHPRDLTNPAFRATMSRARYTEVIREGLNGTSMPAWKSVLGEKQIADLIDYIEVAFVEKK
jgi:cytochrome c oxidase cbb3-type subunit 3